MAKWLAETELLQNIASHLLQPHHEHYSQQSIRFNIADHPHLAQRHLSAKNKYQESLYGVLVDRRELHSEYCIIFMHGLASNVLQGASLMSHLLPNTALFCFDFSGSGKSAGSLTAYGCKEYEDVQAVMALLQAEGYRRFILWGRSMGAVAALLHSCHHPNEQVALQVVDSPFSSFQAVCSSYAHRFMGVPKLLVGAAVSVLKECLASHPFNPFTIDLLPLAARCRTPTLFVYNQDDEVIAASNSQEIIRQLPQSCYYERLTIPDQHNHLRSPHSLSLIFQNIKKIIHLQKPNRPLRRRGFDVLSSFMKRHSQTQLRESQGRTKEGEGETAVGFRRSAIYCSLSKKSSCFLSPKLPKKKPDNPQSFLRTNCL